MNSRAREILARFEARADEIAGEIADATMAEVGGFGPMLDATLRSEVRTLARHHLTAFLAAARTGGGPSARILAATGERAAARARQLVPLAALLHSYLIAQRVISAAITREAGTGAESRGAALDLNAMTFDYNIAVTTAMADAYVAAVQDALAELDSARRALIDALLNGNNAWPELTRRAIGLGFDPDHTYVVAVAAVDLPGGDPKAAPQRWAVETMVRASGKAQRNAFVVTRDRELVCLLDTGGADSARAVLGRAALAIRQTHQAMLRAGVGPPFAGIAGFAASYHEARRALRHATARRPFVSGPGEVLLFDELTNSAGKDAALLIPPATRQALADPALRAALEAFIEADNNVVTAAKALMLHPNSLRYRLRRIAELTGRDPRKLTDLLELIAASRLTSAPGGHPPAAPAGSLDEH